MCEVVYEVPKAGMSYEAFVTILLTVVLVILAVLAIIIAVAAIVGWAGFKDAVKDAVEDLVGPAMDAKLKEYPDASKYIELYQEIQSLYLIHKKLVEKPESKTVASASYIAVQEEKAKPAPVEQPAIHLAEIYPGEGQPNADGTTAAGPADPDAGPDHS
jgi:hypothetical protein